jgi:hypothetical protein
MCIPGDKSNSKGHINCNGFILCSCMCYNFVSSVGFIKKFLILIILTCLNNQVNFALLGFF